LTIQNDHLQAQDGLFTPSSTLDFVKVMLGVQTTCGLLERMPDVRHFEWMKSEKKKH
jgi:hypothetical protein